jgi:hypothetical protein
MATSAWHLQQKQERLKREIGEHLDFLIGSVSSQGATGRFNLTTKVNGKTTSKYIRAGMEEEVRRKTRRHQKLKALLKEIAEVNWELFVLENRS